MSNKEPSSLSGYIQHLYLADAYAIQPSLKVRGQPKSASFYGLIFTLLVIGYLLSYCYHLAFDLLNHKHPAVFSCDQPGETIHSDLSIFTSDTFQMGFGLVNQTTGVPYMDNTIYTVKASLKVASSAPNTHQVQWNVIPLDIEPCKSSHANWDQQFTLSGLWCLKEQQSAVDKLYVRGADDSFINIEFSRCNPSVSEVNCSVDIDAQLRKSTWQAYYTEWAMNPNLYKTPMVPSFQPFKAGLPLNLQRKVSLFLKTLLYETDAGWLTEEQDEITVVEVERINYDFYDRDESDPVFMSAEIMNSGNLLMHMRKYKKLAELFAQVEGLAVVIIPILGLLVLPYSTFKMYEQATNDIYNIHTRRSPHKKNRKNGKTSTSTTPSRKESQSVEMKQQEKIGAEDNNQQKAQQDDRVEARKLRYISMLNQENNNDEATPLGVAISQGEIKESSNHAERTQRKQSKDENKNETIIIDQEGIKIEVPTVDVEKAELEKATKEDFQDDNKANDHNSDLETEEPELQPFSLSYYEWLKSFCKPDPRMKVITRSRNEIEGSIDVVGILKRFIEIDKLKECLLTQEQRVLFDNLRRPIPSMTKKGDKITDEDKNGMKVSWKQSYNGDVETVRRVYEELKTKKCKSELDEKILALYKERNCGVKQEDLYH